jgi:hypothetical protein
MTKDDIIKLAREAGFADSEGVVHAAYQLEAFANLVAAALRDEMWESAMKLVAEAVAAERDFCAKVCDELQQQWRPAGECADAIRARNKS